MKATLPFVSVCLLTYNRAADLPQTLDSLLEQSHSDFELIINDDRSPDNTEIICREYEKKDPRVRYFRNKTNLRYADNQNAAIARASSDYIAIVHDGDIYQTDLIEQWTRALVAAPHTAIVFNAYRVVRPSGEIVIESQNLPPVSDGKKLLDYMLSRLDSPIFGIVMVRLKCVQAVGPFDSRLSTLADIDMWMRLLSSYDVAYVHKPLITIHPREKGHHNNLSNIDVRRQLEQVYVTNLSRNYYGESDTRMQSICRKLNKANLMSLLWCIRHLKGILVCRWIFFISSSRKRRSEFWKEGRKGRFTDGV